MSGTINKVMLIGHTGDEVKMHYFEGGNSIGRFPLATNETYTNRSTGERVNNTEWHNIVVRNNCGAHQARRQARQEGVRRSLHEHCC